MLLLVLQPREEAGRGPEGPELEYDLAVLRVLRLKLDPLALMDHVNRLFEGDLVVMLALLAAREVHPRHVEEEEPSSRLPHPPLPRLDQGLLRKGDGLEDRVVQGAVSDDLVVAREDGLVRVREDDAHLTDLIDLHLCGRTPGPG
jgi:hypothetical protein